MLKKVLLITTFAILLVGCGEVQPTEPAVEDTIDNVTPVVEDTTVVDDSTDTPPVTAVVEESALYESEIYKTIIAVEDLSLDNCNELKNENLKERCEAVFYTNMAVAQLNSTFCENINLEFEKEQCLLLSSTEGRESQQSGILN